MILIQGGKSLYPWMKQHISYLEPEFVTEHSFALVYDGKAIAAWSYFERGHDHWEVTIATSDKRWCKRWVIKFILSYPFDVLLARRVTAQCLAENESATRLLSRVGFEFEGRLRSFFNGKDVLIFSMLRGENGRYS